MLSIIAELLPAAMPPTIGLYIIYFNLILPLIMLVKQILQTTQAEMQKKVLIRPLKLKISWLGMSILRNGKKTQQNNDPTDASKKLKLPAFRR